MPARGSVEVRFDGFAERPYLRRSEIDVWRVVETWQALGQSRDNTAASLGISPAEVQAALEHWLDHGAGTVQTVVAAGPPGPPTDIVQRAGQIAALFGGVATVVYIAGGIVLALRLAFAHVNPEAVTGQLPREFLLTVGLGQVLLPAILLVGIYITYRLLERNYAHPPGTLPWYSDVPGNRWRFAAAAWLAAALLVAPGAIAAAATNRGDDERSLNDPELWWCFVLATVACLLLLVALSFSGRAARRSRTGPGERRDWERRVARTATTAAALVLVGTGALAATTVSKADPNLPWLLAALGLGAVVGSVLVEVRARLAQTYRHHWGSARAIAASAALYSGGVVFAAVVFWPAFARLEPAKVCTTAGFEESGDLIGHTAGGVYLAEGRPTQRRVAAFPTSQVEEVFVGPDAGGAACDARGASGKAHAVSAISASQHASVARRHARAAHAAARAAAAAPRLRGALAALGKTAAATTAAGRAAQDTGDAVADLAAARARAAHRVGVTATRVAERAQALADGTAGTPGLRVVRRSARRTASSASRASAAASEAARAALSAVASAAG